jgi:phosphoserine phosphatase RsbU/P
MKLERPVLVIVAAIVFLLDFIFLIARNALESSSFPGTNLLHSMLFGMAMAVTAFAFFSSDGAGEHSPVQRLGRLVLLAALLLTLFLVFEIAGLLRFEEVDGIMAPVGAASLIFSILVSIGAGILCIGMFRVQTHLIFTRRKRNTGRAYAFLIATVAAYVVSRYVILLWSNGRSHDNPLTVALLALVVVAMVVNSFRFAWIVSLTRREKLITLGLSILGCTLFIVTAVNYELYRPALHSIHPLLHDLALMQLMFGAIYTGIGFWSTLLHLPTAKEFDRKREEISSFHTMGRLMTQVFDRQELIETATQLAIHTGNADGGWIELCRPVSQDNPDETGSFRVSIAPTEWYGKNLGEEMLQALEMHDGLSLRQLVLQTGKPAIVHDSARDRRLAHRAAEGKEFASIALLPLNTHRTTIGLLGLVKRPAYEFDKDVQHALAAFADLAAVAIENSRLISESLERERFKQEMIVARTMQHSLLPALLPLADTYDIAAQSIPAYEVGGDYYDVVRIDEERLGIVVGDVSGKGVPAALYMAQVKGIFQSLAHNGAMTHEMLVRMNGTLCQSMDRKSFISILYAVLNIRTGILTFSRAGHCPLLYISDGAPRYMRPNGMGLGLDPSARFAETIEEETIQLQPNDVVVLYTDGVTEARNAHGEEFHYERLADVVASHRERSAEVVTAAVVQAVRRHADAGDADDDMTILVLRWNGGESPEPLPGTTGSTTN